MRNIVIVDATSTGRNFITDAIKRNYRPVVLDLAFAENADPSLTGATAANHRLFAGKADFITERVDYADTLEEVRRFDPLLVIPGGEGGVELATRLADDLGLPGNPYSGIDKLIHKDAMHAALKEYGIRYIRGKVVESVEEALEYYRTEKFRGCVVKPTRGGGTVGVHLCDNEEELVAALKEEFGGFNVFGEKLKVLLQERIYGTEYIVNTVSRNGHHRLSSIWRYAKKKVEGGGNVYDYAETIGELEAGHSRLVRYAFDVADAIGYRNGPIHGEYMIDEKGPILIEVNCRVMGAGMTEAFADCLFGHHETDNALDSYLDPQWHEKMMDQPYRPLAKGYFKVFINPEDVSVELSPVLGIVKHLRSFCGARIGAPLSGRLVRTVDFETTGGIVSLASEDELIVRKDLEFLRKVEKEYFGMLFTGKKPDASDCPEKLQSVREVMDGCGCDRSVVVLTNDPKLDVNACILPSGGECEVGGKFNWGVLDLGYFEAEDAETMTEDFYRLASLVKKGGKIVVPEKTYWHLPCGIEAAEILGESLGLIIEAPAASSGNALVMTVV